MNSDTSKHPICSAKKYKPKTIQKTYGDYLETMPWDFFCTLTTKYDLSESAARRLAENFQKRLQKNNGNVRMFFVSEPFDRRYGFHIHALLYFEDRRLVESSYAIDVLRNNWKVVSKGGIGQESNYTIFRRYVKNGGANFYLVKYMSREGVDFDLLV